MDNVRGWEFQVDGIFRLVSEIYLWIRRVGGIFMWIMCGSGGGWMGRWMGGSVVG